MRKLIGIVSIVIVIILLSPWATGYYLQQVYQREIARYNATGEVAIQIAEYHRSWWHSNAVLRVHIMNSSLVQLWKEFGVENPHLNLTIEQAIHHGPILFTRSANSPKFLGLATIQNTLHLSPDILKVFKTYGDNASLVLESKGLFSLTGHYFNELKLAPFRIILPDNNFNVQFNQGFQLNAWLIPTKNHLIIDAKVSGFKLTGGDDYIAIPDAHIKLDQYMARSGLWMGKANATLSEIMMHDTRGYDIRLTGINLNGETKEASNKLSGSRDLFIEQLEFNKQMMGPLKIKMSASGLNAKAILKLITIYRKIAREGELYASQLEQNLLALFPSVFSKKSEIKLETFEFSAPEGTLHAHGKIGWPIDESSANDVVELLQDANAQLDLRISKSLTSKWIDTIGVMPYFRSITYERRKQLLDMDSNIQAASQRNLLFISMLVKYEIMSEDTAIQLLNLQRNDASIANYSAVLKELYLQKNISRTISYMLFWQYADVDHQANLLMKALDADQADVKKQYVKQLNDWIKQGYIKQDSKEYYVIVRKESGEIKVNGKQILDQSKLSRASRE